MREEISTTPRTRPPQERREQLMNAARSLFLDHGVGATTIEQITSLAGVAKGSFYLHFTSKEEVRQALGDQFAQSHLACVEAAISKRPQADWSGRLIAWVAASVGFYLDSVQLHDMLFYEGRTPTREGLVENIVISHLQQLLEDGMAAGAWQVDDPRSTAVFLFSGFHGVIDDAVSKTAKPHARRLALRLQKFCLRTVGLPEIGI